MRDRDSLPYRCSMQANSTSSDAFGRNQDRIRVESWYSSFPFNSIGKRGGEREWNFWIKLHIYVYTCIRWKEKWKKMCTRSKTASLSICRFRHGDDKGGDISNIIQIISTREERIRIAGNERVRSALQITNYYPKFRIQNSFPLHFRN